MVRTARAATSVVRVRVRFGETDLMGIVHHASYASYMEVARIEWLRRRGVQYSDWATHGYPFSTLDMVLGPTRLYCIRRKVDPEQLKTLLNEPKSAPSHGQTRRPI